MSTGQGGGSAPDLKTIRTSIESAKALAEEVVAAVRQLPRVEPDGTSECPFAEELYAKKDALVQRLETQYSALCANMPPMEAEIQRCRHNLATVDGGHARLTGDRARSHFSEAEAELAQHYRNCVQLRDRLREAIQFVQGILQAASSRAYTGEYSVEPQGWSDTATWGSAAETDMGEEIENLFELDQNRQH